MKETNLVILRNEEHGSTKSSLSVLFTRYLVVKESLYVVDRKEMLSVHRNDDGVPNLRDEDLGLVLDFHIGSCEDLGVDTLGETFEDICEELQPEY